MESAVLLVFILFAIVIFLLGIVALGWPLISIPARRGVTAFFVYLFAVWIVLVALAAILFARFRGLMMYIGAVALVTPPSLSGARLIFSCGWHITMDGQDEYSWGFKAMMKVSSWAGRLTRMVDINDQVEATRRIFASDARWTVVRGSDLEEGESQRLPVWSRHVGDPILASNRTRRVDFALFMVEALENDELIHEAPAIVGCRTPSAGFTGTAWTTPGSPATYRSTAASPRCPSLTPGATCASSPGTRPGGSSTSSRTSRV